MLNNDMTRGDRTTPIPKTGPKRTRLTDERPGARFRRLDQKIEIIDKGTLHPDGHIRSWVDYRTVDETEHLTGPLCRATSNDPDPEPPWRLLKCGDRADYHLEVDDETAEIRVVPLTSAARDWCRDAVGSRNGGVLSTDTIPEKMREATDTGLVCGTQSLLETFLGSQTVKPQPLDASLWMIEHTMARLRAEEGCLWCREQTLKTLQQSVLSEAHETVRAIDRNSPGELLDELSDLLLQVVFLSCIANETKQFSLFDVVKRLDDKIIKRHPHVFERRTGDPQLTPDQVQRQREVLKNAERRAQTDNQEGLLDTIPETLPALLRATHVMSRLNNAALGAPDASSALEEAARKLDELRIEMHGNPERTRTEELTGKLLMNVAAAMGHTGANGEASLQRETDRTIKHVQAVETSLRTDGLTILESTTDRRREEWERTANAESP